MSSSSSYNRPSVIQLATIDSAIVIHLVRNHKNKKYGIENTACVPILQSILSDDSIVKVGASIDQDMLSLMEWQRCLVCKSRFDLGRLRDGSTNQNDHHTSAQYDTSDYDHSTAKNNNDNGNGNSPGLQTLAASILGVHLPKSKSVSTSNWMNVPLSYKQVSYSAYDAWVGAAIAHELSLRDAATFGTNALANALRQQEIPMDVLYHRSRKRKHSKYLLSKFLEHESSNNQSNVVNSPLSNQKISYRQQQQSIPPPNVSVSTRGSTNRDDYNNNHSTRNNKHKTYTRAQNQSHGWKSTIIRELKQIMKTSIHDQHEIIDIRRLGLRFIKQSSFSRSKSSSYTPGATTNSTGSNPYKF